MDPSPAPEKFTDDLPVAVRTRLAQIRVRRRLRRGVLAAGAFLALGAFLLPRVAPSTPARPAVTQPAALASSGDEGHSRGAAYRPIGLSRDLPPSGIVRRGIVGPVPRAYSPHLTDRLLREGI